jgi:hypothetical protein
MEESIQLAYVLLGGSNYVPVRAWYNARKDTWSKILWPVLRKSNHKTNIT